jgi:hypothetical protein
MVFNMIRRNFITYFSMVFLIGLVGCTLPGTPALPSLDPGPAYTQAAATIIAGLTQVAPSLPEATPTQTPPVASDTPAPSETPLPSPTSTPLPSETPSPTPALEKVLFQDDFEGNTSWFTEDNDRFRLQYQDDGYAIRVDIPNAPVWSVRNQDLTDVILEVDAARIDGPANGYFGLTCRHQDDNNYYLLLISSSGDYGIAKVADGEFNFLDQGTDQEGVIQGGDATNRLRAECIGDRLILIANGHQLLETQDDDFDSGDIGLVVKTRKETGLDILFDNFTLLEEVP